MELIRLVVGPLGGSGVAEAVAAVPGTNPLIVRSADQMPASLGEAEVVVTFRWSDDWLIPSLRWVQSVSAGTDQFPLDLLRSKGVVLTSARGIHETQVSEHALGLLLAMTRGIATAATNQASRNWVWSEVTELSGKTLGVLGLGVIGEGVARRARAFGMRVIGTKRNPGSYEGAAEKVFGPEGTLEVFRAADVVVITLPGTTETEHLVGAAELEALSGGWLVNVGRGSVIDTDALITAMGDGRLKGVALDVFEQEPLPQDSPLWDLPGVLVSPHLAGLSPRYGERLAALFERNLAAYRGEAEWVNRVV
ncbi:MAG: D-2-hydroxyacid dehydrogenase [Acidimicrobiia bacterium]